MGILSHTQRRAEVEEKPSQLSMEVSASAVLLRARDIIENSNDYLPCDLAAAVWAGSRNDGLAFRRAFRYLRAYTTPAGGEVEDNHFSRRITTHATKTLCLRFLTEAAGWAAMVEQGIQAPPPPDTTA